MENIKDKFPILKNHKELIYLDNASTTQKPQSVIDAVSDYYSSKNANVHRGIYDLAEESTKVYENARAKIAEFINAEPEEVIFVPGATEAINWIAKSLYTSGFIKVSPRIVLTDLEHHSNILPWQALEPEVVQYLGIDDNFEIEESKFMDNADLFATVHASNTTGTIVPIEKYIAENEYPYSVIDATQSIAHMPIDVKKIGADFLIFSGHKLYGPMGIGIIYAKKEILEQLDPFMKGGGMIDVVTRESATWGPIPQRFEAGTPNVAGASGLASAVDFINEIGWDRIQEHENQLRMYTLERLNELENIEIYHPRKVDAAPVISFSHKEVHAHDIAQYLGDNSICVRAGHHCTQILHNEVIKTPASVRVSLGIYNTREDIEKFIDVLKVSINHYISS